MSIRITAAERDALYDQIYVRLSGIDDVWIAAQAEDYARADRLAREFADDLQLLIEDLGWGEGRGEPLEIATPPPVLRRVLARMQDRAENLRALEEKERAEGLARQERTERLLKACRRVLAALDTEEVREGPPRR